MRRLPWAFLIGLVACGPSVKSTSTDEVVDDVTALQQSVAADTCPSAIEDVDRAVDEDKPVLAARLLHGAAIPAAARQMERLRGLTLRSPDGRALQREGIQLYDARRAALVLYANALERGIVEDMQLVLALEAQRQADRGLAEFLLRLEGLRPLATPTKAAPAGGAEPEGAPSADGRSSSAP